MPRYEGTRRGYVGHVVHNRNIPLVEDTAPVPVQVQFEFEHEMGALFGRLPERIGALRDALGGTNKAAKLLPGKKPGTPLAPRSLQRFIAAEEHHNVSAHSIRRADYAKREDTIKRLQTELIARRRGPILRDGMRVTATGSLRIGGYTETRHISIHLPGKAWQTIFRRWDKGTPKDIRAAALAFQQWFGRVYGRSGPPRKGEKRTDFSWGYLNELNFEPPG